MAGGERDGCWEYKGCNPPRGHGAAFRDQRNVDEHFVDLE